jgi:predicted small secreted protein
MSRRHLTYAALVITSVVLAACSQPTAPRGEDTIGTCRGGIVVGSGKTCDGQ